MQSQSHGNETLSSAESAFIEFLSKRGTGEGVDFEALCVAHPDVDAELRALYDDWARLDRLIAAGSGRDDLRRKLERHFGASIDDCVDLHADSSYDVVEGEVLKRLTSHSPNVTRYQPRGKIAEGGMGEILRVWDQDLRRTLAMKVMRSADRTPLQGPRQRSQARVLARFLEEAQITGQLDHPGIVPVHELGVDNEGHVYFTMPLVRGREFKEIIELARGEREGWSMRRALGVLIKVCEATGYAHAKGVIHRDLKPGNVMVGRFGETYVMDWGLARIIGRRDAHAARSPTMLEPLSQEISTDRSHAKESTPGSPLKTRDGIVIGTPAYMPPEQARGEIDLLDPRSDVYSIGAVLYQLLTGHVPHAKHNSDTAQVILARVLEGPPVRVHDLDPGVPQELSAICEKAMAREPSGRYVDALELARDIEAYLGLRPVAAREPSALYALQLFYKRNRAMILASAAGLLLLAIWGVVYAIQRSAESRTRQLLHDRNSAELLVQEEARLYPAIPAMVERMDGWLASTREVLSRNSERRNTPDPDPELATFGSNLVRLEALMPVVDQRRNLADGLDERTLDRPKARWTEVRNSIRASDRYGGLELTPQLGLIPLQLNPSSGLWEFWLESSGEEPKVLDAASGSLEITGNSAIVLVLLPAGRATIGPLEEPSQEKDCMRVHDVDFPAFFIGKHEVTQGQWSRIEGSNYSRFVPGYRLSTLESENDDSWFSLASPIECVSFYDGSRFAGRVGCRLPTEDEWEYACRAGSTAQFFWGSGSKLIGRENVADDGVRREVPWPKAELLSDDGFPFTAPVASFEPNAFGLFDMHGNVSEWCDTWYEDCVNPQLTKRLKIFRGGSWYMPWKYGASAFRHMDAPHALNHARGFRIARSVDP